MADYAALLRDHVTLTCRSADRIFLQGYVPKLQSVGGVCQFLYWRRGFGIPSSAAFGKVGDAYVAEVYQWAKANAIPVRRFAKVENKEQIAWPLDRGRRARRPRAGGAHRHRPGEDPGMAILERQRPRTRGASTHGVGSADGVRRLLQLLPCYLWDPDWGGAFWKTNAYAPRPVWIWLNEHSRAQRQCAKLGIEYTALTTGLAAAMTPWRCSGSVIGSGRAR
jgi:hypothetical protein